MRENVLVAEVVLAERQGHPHRAAGAEILGRLRPDAPLRRLGGNARHHHRGDAAPARHPRDDLGRALRLPRHCERREYRDRSRPARASRSPAWSSSTSRRCDAVNRFSKTRPSRRRHALPRIPRHARHGRGAGRASCATIAADHGGEEFRWASSAEDRATLWQARHDAYYAALALRPGAKGWPTDVCVPISRLAECILRRRRRHRRLERSRRHRRPCRRRQLPRASSLVDPDDPAELAEVARINKRMIDGARARRHVHGRARGRHRKDPLHGGRARRGLEVMHAIKAALDPQGIMNPGKVLPD